MEHTPPEPPPPPRPFPLRRIGFGSGFALLFGGIWSLVGGIISTVFLAVDVPFWHDWRLDTHGRQVQAQPTAVEPTNSSVNGRVAYEITFRFGEHEGHTSTTDPRLIQDAQAGRPLTLDVDPENPALVRVHGHSASVFGWFLLIPLGFALVGGVVVLLGARGAWVRRRLYVHGQATLAAVSAVTPGAGRVNGVPVMHVDYVFQGPMGPCQGRDSTRTPPPVGARVWVLHDPETPERNALA